MCENVQFNNFHKMMPYLKETKKYFQIIFYGHI